MRIGIDIDDVITDTSEIIEEFVLKFILLLRVGKKLSFLEGRKR